MLRHKGIDSVKASKVKGHATEVAVEEGKVKPQDKAGNDQADKGADKGGGVAQAALAELAGFFSYRNERYRMLFTRIQLFIVKMEKAEKQKRDEIMRSQDPFNSILQELCRRRRTKKQRLTTHLGHYGNADDDAKTMGLKDIRRIQYSNEKEQQYQRQLLNCIGNARWAPQEVEACCTIWLEFHTFSVSRVVQFIIIIVVCVA